MEREKAIAHVKDMYEHMFFREDKEALETLIPELRESEGERIRKWIYNLVSDLDPQDDDAEKELDEMKPLALTWLEKQKDHFRDDTKMVEQKPAEVDESTKRLNDNWMKQHFDDYEEQKPAEWSEEDKGILLSIKCVIDSVWHNSDYDCSKEELKEMWNWLDTRWQRVEYPQPKREWSEEQDYSGLTDFERTIHRGFLAAGVENVPVGIIEDTAFECLGFLALNDDKSVEWDEYTKPQWKPSEDEDNKNSK